MLKKLIALLVATIIIVGFCGIDKSNKAHTINIEKAIKATNELRENTPYADEYYFYTYKITKKTDNAINGVGLDNNGNVVLPKKYNNTNLQEGDVVVVVFAEEEIVGIHKLIITENDNYMVARDFIN